MARRLDIHDRVLDAPDKDALMDAYAQWADHYDDDLVSGQGYVAPRQAAELLASRLDTADARILDAGCGTGLVGTALAERAKVRLTGVDYSADMLRQAERLGIYEALERADLTEPLAFDDGAFDALVCVGTLTLGHVGPEALTEFVRVVRPGGLLCFTVREQAWEQDDYAAVVGRLGDQGAWETLEMREADYILEEGSTCRLALMRVRG